MEKGILVTPTPWYYSHMIAIGTLEMGTLNTINPYDPM